MTHRTLLLTLVAVGAVTLAAAPVVATSQAGARHARGHAAGVVSRGHSPARHGPRNGRHTHGLGRAGERPELDGDGRAAGKHGHHLRQFEGVIVSVAPTHTSLVLQPMNPHAATVEVAIGTSTVITAAAASSAALVTGEQVHIAARANPDGTYTAVRVMGQAPEHEADDTPEAADTPEADAGD